MKYRLLLLLAALSLASCSNEEKSGCDFNKAKLTISRVGNSTPMEEKEVSDCFVKSKPDETGLVEVKGQKTADQFKVLYYDQPSVDMLTIKFATVSSDWRRKKGHDIIKVEKPDTLGFIFGDRYVSKVKGSVLFVK